MNVVTTHATNILYDSVKCPKNYVKLYIKGYTNEKLLQNTFIENYYNLEYSTFVYENNNNLYVSKLITEPEENINLSNNKEELKYNVRQLHNEIFSLFYNVYYNVLDKFDQNNIFNVYKQNLFSQKNKELNKIAYNLSDYVLKMEFDKPFINKYDLIKTTYPTSEVNNNLRYHDVNIHCFNMNLILRNYQQCSIKFDHEKIYVTFYKNKNNFQVFEISDDLNIIEPNKQAISLSFDSFYLNFYIRLCEIHSALKKLLELPSTCSNELLNNKPSTYYKEVLNNLDSLKDFASVLFYKYPEISDDIELKIVRHKRG